MAADEKLRYIFDAVGNKKVEQAFAGVGTSASKAGGQVEAGGKRISSTIGGVALKAGALAGVGAGLFAFGSKAVGAFSDLNEVSAKVGEIFGSSADEIRTWAETAADSFGQSERSAMDAAATFATFGKSAGLAGGELVTFSTGMTELASDLASFHNSSPEDAITAIGAALRGESEPIRRFGVLLDDATLKARAFELGLVSSTKNALTPQVKVLAAQAEILAQTSDAQGDYARTSDGLANKQRELSAKMEDASAAIGEKLIPMVLSATDTIIGLTEATATLLDVVGFVPKQLAKISGETPWQKDAREAREAYERDQKYLAEQQVRLNDVFYQASIGMGAYADEINAAGADVDQFGNKIEVATGYTQRGNKAAEEFNATLRVQSNRARDASEAMADLRAEFSLVNEGYKALTSELDDADAWASLTGKLDGLAEAFKTGKNKGKEYEQQVRDAKREVIEFGLEARSYVPAELLATINVEIDEGKLAEALRRLSNIRINATIVARGGAGYAPRVSEGGGQVRSLGGGFQAPSGGSLSFNPRERADPMVGRRIAEHQRSYSGLGGNGGPR